MSLSPVVVVVVDIAAVVVVGEQLMPDRRWISLRKWMNDNWKVEIRHRPQVS